MALVKTDTSSGSFAEEEGEVLVEALACLVGVEKSMLVLEFGCCWVLCFFG